MKYRIAVWGLVGLLVAAFWMILSVAVPMWREPVLMELARFTCPIVAISWALNFGVKWYWVILTNVAAYALIGLIIETLRSSHRQLHAASR